MPGQPADSGSTAFVGTEAAQARIARLRARRGAAERVNAFRREMAEADRTYAADR